MLVKATYIFEFEPDTSYLEDGSNKKEFALEVTKDELAYMLIHKEISVEDFDFEVEDDNNDHPLPDDCPFNGDTTNDCKDCIYSSDYHYDNEKCIEREVN